MEVMLVLTLLYWCAVGVTFVIGLIKLISALLNKEATKPALKLLITSVILVVVGAGACAVILTGL